MAEGRNYITQHQWAKIIAEAWLDDEFREALEKDPAAAIKERFDFDFDYVLKVPPRPSDLSDEQLDEIRQSDDAVHFRCSAIDRCSLFSEDISPQRCSIVRRCSEETTAGRCSEDVSTRCSEDVARRCSEPSPQRCSEETPANRSSEDAASDTAAGEE